MHYYDKQKLLDIFNEGGQVFNKLISKFRTRFMDYIEIHDDMIKPLVDGATGNKVDGDDLVYSKVYQKIQEWGKNWAHQFFQAADELMEQILNDNRWTTIAATELGEAYFTAFEFKHLYTPIAYIPASKVDCCESLRTSVDVTVLYRTIYVHTIL